MALALALALAARCGAAIDHGVRVEAALRWCQSGWMSTLRPSTRRFAPAQDEEIFCMPSQTVLILSHEPKGLMSRRTHRGSAASELRRLQYYSEARRQFGQRPRTSMVWRVTANPSAAARRATAAVIVGSPTSAVVV